MFFCSLQISDASERMELLVNHAPGCEHGACINPIYVERVDYSDTVYLTVNNPCEAFVV